MQTDHDQTDSESVERVRRPNARRVGLILGLAATATLASATAQAFTYRTHLGGVLDAGGPIASVDIWPPDRQGRFFDDIRFLSANARSAVATQGHRYRALRTGISIAVPPDRGEGSGTDFYASTFNLEIADLSAPRAAQQYDPPLLAVEYAFSVPVSWEWSNYDVNENEITDYGDFYTTVRVEALEYVIDLEAYGSLLVEMSAEEITCRGSCQGGLGDIYVTWSPIPEPGTATLLGLGLAGLACRRVRGRDA